MGKTRSRPGRAAALWIAHAVGFVVDVLRVASSRPPEGVMPLPCRPAHTLRNRRPQFVTRYERVCPAAASGRCHRI